MANTKVRPDYFLGNGFETVDVHNQGLVTVLLPFLIKPRPLSFNNFFN